MKFIQKTLLASALVFSLHGSATASSLTFDYVGNPFTSVGSLALGDRVTASVTFAESVEDDFSGHITNNLIESLSISAGNTFDLSTGFLTGEFWLQDGLITNWSVKYQPSITRIILTENILKNGFTYQNDRSSSSEAHGANANRNLPGVWTLHPEDDTGPSPVPLPAAAWLFGSTLIGWVMLSRRRRTQ